MQSANPFLLSYLPLLLLYCLTIQQCSANGSNPSIQVVSTTQPRSYIRDSPLHEKLVNDTWKALDKFIDDDDDDSGRKRKKKKKYRPRYFEGWYYKIDLPGEGGVFVVIPGLYLRKEEQHGFVMVLDATGGGDEPVCYFYDGFPIGGVAAKPNGDHDFLFRLDDRNVFTAHGFALDLPADGKNPSVAGNASWAAPLPLPATRRNPTIMGWFSWLPRGTMQCSHGVVSMDHTIDDGTVAIGSGNNNTKVVNLAGARGYVEKDWGREFPERYTWIQANDFCNSSDDGSAAAAIPGASFLVSVASIPVKPFENRLQFTGFLSFLRYPDESGMFRTIRFATYTGAKVSYSYNITTDRRNPDDDDDDKKKKPPGREHTVVVTMTSSRHVLTATVTGDRDGAATLWGPLPSNPSGGMKPYVREMLNCPVRVVLKRRKDGVVLFDGTARHGGFEIEGHDDTRGGSLSPEKVPKAALRHPPIPYLPFEDAS